ncbi:MAG: 4-phosphopantoate--beta-alanine ligase [Archaeoglobales archaeon]|nr:4-phosphopantoate--beta-alanine ligase [Archaeoglobales archaeon]
MIPKSHPRYHSLLQREKIIEGLNKGIVSQSGLIAQGRGEAFDYILGEKTHEFALKAEKAAVAALLLAKHPVISVNGNAAALAGKELCELAKILDAKVEVNIFYFTKERIERIKEYLEKFDCEVLAACDAELKGLESARRIVDSRGILIADTVLVPLEDGDRCEILKKHGKKVIAIDLNPLSRTARMADITIVDNIVRAVPNMIELAKELKGKNRNELEQILAEYDNKKILHDSIVAIRDYLSEMASKILQT